MGMDANPSRWTQVACRCGVGRRRAVQLSVGCLGEPQGPPAMQGAAPCLPALALPTLSISLPTQTHTLRQPSTNHSTTLSSKVCAHRANISPSGWKELAVKWWGPSTSSAMCSSGKAMSTAKGLGGWRGLGGLRGWRRLGGFLRHVVRVGGVGWGRGCGCGCGG